MTDLSIILLVAIAIVVGFTAGVMWAWRESTDTLTAILLEKVEHEDA